MLAAAEAADAEGFPATRGLLASDGITSGSARGLGIAGALAGVGEGGEALFQNPAAAAGLDFQRDRSTDVSLAFAFHLLPKPAASSADFDNDGEPDEAPATSAARGWGRQVVLLALQTRRGRWGVGVGALGQSFPGERDHHAMDVSLLRLQATLGYAFGHDDALVGGGLSTLLASLSGLEGGIWPTQTTTTAGVGLQLGALYRPHGENVRVGLAFFSPIGTGPLPTSSVPAAPPPFPWAMAPGRVSAGLSTALGPGHAFNLSEAEESDAGPPRRTLLVAQMDVLLPVQNAGLPLQYLQSSTGVPFPLAGNRPAFVPRVGMEQEVIDGRLRLRTGGYLEPAGTTAGQPRGHLTLGFELLLVRVGPWRVSFGFAADVAREYLNLSFGPVAWN